MEPTVLYCKHGLYARTLAFVAWQLLGGRSCDTNRHLAHIGTSIPTNHLQVCQKEKLQQQPQQKEKKKNIPPTESTTTTILVVSSAYIPSCVLFI